jgi:hypothetical protein
VSWTFQVDPKPPANQIWSASQPEPAKLKKPRVTEPDPMVAPPLTLAMVQPVGRRPP